MRLTFWLIVAFAINTTVGATPVAIDFEGLPDSTLLSSQYAGITFSNAIIISAGIGLNEFEFPPHSGVNVASDNGGPMSISFSSPVQSFSGYFTYAEPLTIEAFGAGNNLLASITSPFTNNEALSGVAGSSPNELLEVSSLPAISYITITGDPAGGSFALDDATYETQVSGVPEGPTWLLLLLGSVTVVTLRMKGLS